jgi:hypothetical protein
MTSAAGAIGQPMVLRLCCVGGTLSAMAKVLDTATNQEVDVPDEEVTSLVAAGKALLPKGQVPVVDSRGVAGFVPSEDAAQAMQMGYRFRTAAEIAEEERREKYEDRPVAAGLAAAARGATLGLSDVALTQTGLVEGETLRGLEDYNEAVSIGGEVLGTGATLVFSGGTAAPAALGTRVATKAGMEAAKRLGGRAVVRGAVEGAVEGGLQGLGRAITDDAQGRDPLTAEKALASTMEGAIFGGATGGLLEGAADFLTSGRRTLGVNADAPSGARGAEAPPAEPSRAPDPSSGGSVPPTSPGAPPPPTGTAPGATPAGGPDVGSIADDGLRLALPFKQAVEKNPGTVRRVLETLDSQFDLGGLMDPNKWVLKGLDAKTKHMKRLTDKGLTDDAPALLRLDPRFAAVKNGEDAARLATTIKEEAGNEVRAMASRLDASASPDDIMDVDAFSRRVEEDVIAKLAKGTRDQRAAAARVREELDLLLDRVTDAPAGAPALSPVTRKAGVYEVQIEELDDIPALVRNERRAANIRKGLDDGKDLGPIKVGQGADGLRELADGNHRLAEARARGLKTIRVQFESAEAAAVAPRKRGTHISGEAKAPMDVTGYRSPFDGSPAAVRRLSFTEAEEFKRALDASVYDRTNNTMTGDALRALRGVLNKAQEETAERIGKRLGDDTFTRWKAAKKKFGAAAELDRIGVDRMEVAKTSNRTFSLTDNIAGAAGFAVGGGLNPAGLALSVGAAVLNKWGRENLPFIIARALSTYDSNPAAQKAAKALRKRLQVPGAPSAGATPDAPPPTPGSPSIPHGTPAGEPPVAGAAPEAAPLEVGFEDVLRKAAEQGPAELWVAHTLLSGSTEYRAMAERQGFADFHPESDEEGQRRASTIARVEQAAARFDAKAEAATTGLLSGKRASVKPAIREDSIRRAERAVQAAKDPEALVSEVASRLADVGADAPGLASDMQEVAQRAATFLATKAPAKPSGPLGDIPALRRPWRPSDVELAKWAAYVRAVESPVSVLDDAASGRLTPEGVEALAAVYPALLEDLRGRVLEKLTAHSKALGYSQRVSIGQLLGLELDESMRPAFIASVQALHQQQPEKPQGRGGASPSRVAKRLEGEFSASDRIEMA